LEKGPDTGFRRDDRLLNFLNGTTKRQGESMDEKRFIEETFPVKEVSVE